MMRGVHTFADTTEEVELSGGTSIGVGQCGQLKQGHSKGPHVSSHINSRRLEQLGLDATLGKINCDYVALAHKQGVRKGVRRERSLPPCT